MNQMIKETAEKLLGRSIVKRDGIDIEKIEEMESILKIKLPEYLKEFYTKIGSINLFAKSFQRFLDIDELYFKGNKLVFLEENQGVLIWGVNIKNVDPIVYANNNVDNKWVSKKIKLSEFLNVIMYYQCAQGWENCQFIKGLGNELNEIINKMEKVVDSDSLVIYWENNVLLWYYTDEKNKIINDFIYISGLTEKKIEEFRSKYDI